MIQLQHNLYWSCRRDIDGWRGLQTEQRLLDKGSAAK